MRMQSTDRIARTTLGTALVTAILSLAACGGGGDDATTANPGGTGAGSGSGSGGSGSSSQQTVPLPATALASGDQFIAWMKSWVSAKDDRGAPVRYEKAAIPTDDHGQPVRLR